MLFFPSKVTLHTHMFKYGTMCSGETRGDTLIYTTGREIWSDAYFTEIDSSMLPHCSNQTSQAEQNIPHPEDTRGCSSNTFWSVLLALLPRAKESNRRGIVGYALSLKSSSFSSLDRVAATENTQHITKRGTEHCTDHILCSVL